jgi:hypothetical protein
MRLYLSLLLQLMMAIRTLWTLQVCHCSSHCQMFYQSQLQEEQEQQVVLLLLLLHQRSRSLRELTVSARAAAAAAQTACHMCGRHSGQSLTH